MKESQSIIWTSTITLIVFCAINVVAYYGSYSEINYWIYMGLIILSILLPFTGLILTIAQWKKIGVFSRIYGIIPVIIWLGLAGFVVFKFITRD